jgi:hypothetical protein
MDEGSRGGNGGLYFIVGALVVAVGVIFAVLSGNFHLGGGSGGGTPAASSGGSSAPSSVNVKVESKAPAAPAPSGGK